MEQVQKVRDLEKSIKADIKTVNNVIEIRQVTHCSFQLMRLHVIIQMVFFTDND